MKKDLRFNLSSYMEDYIVEDYDIFNINKICKCFKVNFFKINVVNVIGEMFVKVFEK